LYRAASSLSARTARPGAPEFDHYRPAESLTLSGIGTELPGLDTALDRFERIFQDLNVMLP